MHYYFREANPGRRPEPEPAKTPRPATPRSAETGWSSSRVASRAPAADQEMVDALEACLDSLSRAPTVFGRLVHLARVEKLVAKSHRAAFTEWLSCPLEQQCAELQTYADAAVPNGSPPHDALSSRAYSNLIPRAGVGEAEKSLYFSNLDLVLDIFTGESNPRQSRRLGEVCAQSGR